MEKNLSEYVSISKNIENLKLEKTVKIAIMSSFTLNGLDETIRVMCSELDTRCHSYVSGYNQYNQELLNSQSNYYDFSPNITFLILDIRNFLGDTFHYPYDISDEERKLLVKEKTEQLENIISLFEKNTKSKLVISNFNIPFYSPNGIIETKSNFGFHEIIEEINSSLRQMCKEKNSIYVYDFNNFVSRYGENNIFDYRQFHVGDIQITYNLIPNLANDLMSYVKPLLGKTRKCIVLDLDNTLWGGIVGEDGINGIELGHTPTGKAFVEFQKELLSL